MKNTRVKSRPGMPMNCIDEKGGVEYLRKLKSKGYRKRDAVKEIGCSQPTIDRYCRRAGTKWSML